MADPLSIAASIIGIIGASAKLASIIGGLIDAPVHITDLAVEIKNTQLVFKALQRFLDRSRHLPPQRAALVQLQDIVVILTETVLVFTELESIVTSLAARQRTPWRRIGWARQRSGAVRLVNQLQRHKSSLMLVLQIISW